MLDKFDYKHFPDSKSRIVSIPFQSLARFLNDILPEGERKEETLKKLVEVKDLALKAIS